MLDKNTVLHIAQLSKLELTTEELETFGPQLSAVVDYFNQLVKIDTKGVDALVTPAPIEQVLREDIARASLKVEDVLRNAPEVSGHLYKVPPVV